MRIEQITTHRGHEISIEHYSPTLGIPDRKKTEENLFAIFAKHTKTLDNAETLCYNDTVSNSFSLKRSSQ